jgi:hypothetical protein
MESTVHLSLHGLGVLHEKTKSELIVRMRHELDPLAAQAGIKLVITTKSRLEGELNLEFDSKAKSFDNRSCTRSTWLGEDLGGVVWIKAHSNLRVCSEPDPKSGKRDIRKFLANDRLLGRALANTALHELGHFIGGLEHSTDPQNYMVTGDLPKEKKTMSAQRTFYAGHQHFTPDQKETLVSHLKAKQWVKDDSFFKVNGQ